MVKLSKALSAEGVTRYDPEEYAASYSSYCSESGKATGIWFGKEAFAFGLEPDTDETDSVLGFRMPRSH